MNFFKKDRKFLKNGNKTLAFFSLIGYNKQAFVKNALATIAQSVERLIRNQQVAGPSPASSSKIERLENQSFYFFCCLGPSRPAD